MSEIILEVTKPAFWFSTVFVSLFINSFSNSLKNEIFILQSQKSKPVFWKMLLYGKSKYIFSVILLLELIFFIISYFDDDSGEKFILFGVLAFIYLFFSEVGNCEVEIGKIKTRKSYIIVGLVESLVLYVILSIPIVLYGIFNRNEDYESVLLYLFLIIILLSILFVTIKNLYSTVFSIFQ